MQPLIDVRFSGERRDRSLEAVVQRWVARLEAMHFDVRSAEAMIERDGGKTTVSLTLTLDSGSFASVSVSRDDPYVSISECFRVARRDLLERANTTRMACTVRAAGRS